MTQLGQRTRYWTRDEEEYLMEKWGLLRRATIAARLGRTECAVRNKATLLGITERENFYTAKDVAAIFAVSTKRVIDTWIGHGVLKGRRHWVRVGGRSVFRVMHEDIEEFISLYPEWYEWRRMPYSYFRNLARQVWERDPVMSAEEFARAAGTNRETVRGHVATGRLNAVRVPWGNPARERLRIRQSELRRFQFAPAGRPKGAKDRAPRRRGGMD